MSLCVIIFSNFKNSKILSSLIFNIDLHVLRLTYLPHKVTATVEKSSNQKCRKSFFFKSLIEFWNISIGNSLNNYNHLGLLMENVHATFVHHHLKYRGSNQLWGCSISSCLVIDCTDWWREEKEAGKVVFRQFKYPLSLLTLGMKLSKSAFSDACRNQSTVKY